MSRFNEPAAFKPGDLPPRGYTAWHEWADIQRKAGIKQSMCPTCSLWRTPQELHNCPNNEACSVAGTEGGK